MRIAARALAGAGLVVGAVAGLGVIAGGAEPSSSPTVLGPDDVTVALGIHHSAFDTSTLRVREGTQVRFVISNDDPIRHELIVGGPDVHRRHENGTEAAHPPRPGEVTVDPLATGETTYAFDEPGVVEFACHLPGHLAYGMVGTVQVVPA